MAYNYRCSITVVLEGFEYCNCRRVFSMPCLREVTINIIVCIFVVYCICGNYIVRESVSLLFVYKINLIIEQI